MVDVNVAYAFTAGMVATVNPCGFVMLPVYLGSFLGVGTAEGMGVKAGTGRSLAVALSVSSGFLAVFAGAGALVSWGAVSIGRWSPALTVPIGLMLMIIGVALVSGWEPRVFLPRLDKGGRDRTVRSMFLFGVSYAIASLSCTLPVFSSVVGSTFSRTSFIAGLGTFIAYSAGMTLLLTALTLAIAVARVGLVTKLRRALPYVQRVSGAITALMGAYLIWYGIYALRVQQSGPVASAGPVKMVNNWSARLAGELAGSDPVTAALVFGLIICSVTLVALLRSLRRSGLTDEPRR